MIHYSPMPMPRPPKPYGKRPPKPEGRKPIIAIDFDGCLCTKAYPDVGKPRWSVINRAKAERASGARLILWTCREGQQLRDALAACRSWGLEFDAVNDNLPEKISQYGNNCRKVSADEYWDDKAVFM